VVINCGTIVTICTSYEFAFCMDLWKTNNKLKHRYTAKYEMKPSNLKELQHPVNLECFVCQYFRGHELSQGCIHSPPCLFAKWRFPQKCASSHSSHNSYETNVPRSQFPLHLRSTHYSADLLPSRSTGV
jgi:hypothetical protein